MTRKTKLIAVAAVASACAIGAAGVAVASNAADDDEAPITGSDLERASEAALRHVGEGRVTDTEVGDEESYYEVEVALDDGSQLDVQLDQDFNVVGSEGDDESEGQDD